MNELGLTIRLVQGNVTIELSHIPFENSAFIWPRETSDLKLFFDDGALIIPSELEQSIHISGDYLIFTDTSGIADDGGWDYVKVNHINNVVQWQVWFNNGLVELVFDFATYQSEIIEIMSQLKRLPQNIVIQPSQVVFPE